MRTHAIRPLLFTVLMGVFGTTSVPSAAPVTASRETSGSSSQSRSALYASVGEELIQYGVDVQGAMLMRQSSVTLPAYVQEGWLHPSGRYFYIAWSNRGTSEAKSSGEKSGVTAFRVDSSGALQPHGAPIKLISRPVYITGDITGTHILVAFNDPSGIAVYSIAPDGTLSSEVKPAGPLDVGVYGHQVRVNPSNRSVILVTRGNKPANGKKEDPGALKIMSYHDGVLAKLASIAPGGGYGFQPRHLDFPPSKPWAFLTLEAQNKLEMYKVSSDGMLSQNPVFVKSTVAYPESIHPTQAASTIHLHPSGKFVYVGNRCEDTVDFHGTRVFSGGENTIGVFRIDQVTGEPTLIQSADTHGFHPRTFSIDPSGRLLVVANQDSLAVKEGDRVRTVLPGLTTFRIKADGRLYFVSDSHMDTKGKLLYWVMFVKLR
jgi:6-phosphogluconolactonase (cycloisomerase 2 family)